MEKLTFKNSFHNKKTTATPIEIGETIHDEKYAEFTIKQITKASMALCGIKQCCCHKFEPYCTDEDGNSYLVTQK
jgi:hypothetical protein